jgi:hypothetical protein
LIALSQCYLYNFVAPIIIFGGHFHRRDFTNTLYGLNVYALESGRYMETVGFLSVKKPASQNAPYIVNRRYLDSNLPTFNYHLGTPLDTALSQTSPKGLNILSMLKEAKAITLYDQVIGCVPQNYYMDRVPFDAPNSIFSFLSSNLNTLMKNGSRPILFVMVIHFTSPYPFHYM